ncbi:MAG: hypothetical protein ACI9LV_000596 [Candidatus Nanohaloarchaea archaeon]|jgi:hypothetical protein
MALEWSKNEDWDQEQDNTGVIHDETLQQGYKSGSLKEGLVAYYPMENSGSEILRDAVAKNIGQIKGATWNGSGQVGSDSLNFDGSNDYIPIPGYKSPLDLQGELRTNFTICLWFRTSDGNAGISGVQGGDDPDNADGHDRHIYLTNGNVGLRVYNSGGSNAEPISSGTNYADGNWHHVVFRANSNDGVYGFIDGNQFGYDSNTSISDFTGSDGSWSNLYLMIGHSQDGSNQYFTGEIDDVRVYSRPLSHQEIQALYNLTSPSGREITSKDVPGNESGGISRYKFNGDVTDSWRSNDGTDNTSAGYVNGVYGQAKDFDGSDDEVNLPNLGISGNDSHSISIWMKTSDSTNQTLYFQGDRSTDSQIDFIYQGGTPQFNYAFYSNDLTYNVNLHDGNWHHLIGTYNGYIRKLYLDGKLVAQDQPSSPSIVNDDFSVGYRRASNSSYFNGALDDLRLYDRALSPLEVEKLFHLGSRRINRKEVLH